MLALVRIQMCSLLILACRAVLLPGNYTTRAGRQTDFQLTALKGERVFSNFFFPSVPSKSEPARKLWREALVFICASQAECDGQALSLGFTGSLQWVGGHWRLNVGSMWDSEELGSWQGVFFGGLLQEVGVTSNHPLVKQAGSKSRSQVPDACEVTHCREHHTLVPLHWRAEAHPKNAWLNQDVLRCPVAYCELPLLEDIRDTFWTAACHTSTLHCPRMWRNSIPQEGRVYISVLCHWYFLNLQCSIQLLWDTQEHLTFSFSKVVFCIWFNGTVLSDRDRQKLGRNGAHELCLSLALCHYLLSKELFLGAAYCPKHNHVLTA